MRVLLAPPLDERLDPAERGRVAEQAQAPRERPGGRLARELDREDRPRPAHLPLRERVAGMRRRATGATRGRRAARGTPASRVAAAVCCRTRSPSVRTPRRTSQVSSAPGTAPVTVRVARSPSASAGSRATRTPPSASEWPDEELRHRVIDEVRAERERLLEHRGREGPVHDEARAGGAGARGVGGDVLQLAGGVPRRLEPDDVARAEIGLERRPSPRRTARARRWPRACRGSRPARWRRAAGGGGGAPPSPRPDPRRTTTACPPSSAPSTASRRRRVG